MILREATRNIESKVCKLFNSRTANIIMHFNLGYNNLLKDIRNYTLYSKWICNALFIKALSKVLPNKLFSTLIRNVS